jgi:hypothetical protein
MGSSGLYNRRSMIFLHSPDCTTLASTRFCNIAQTSAIMNLCDRILEREICYNWNVSYFYAKKKKKVMHNIIKWTIHSNILLRNLLSNLSTTFKLSRPDFLILKTLLKTPFSCNTDTIQTVCSVCIIPRVLPHQNMLNLAVAEYQAENSLWILYTAYRAVL